MQVRAARGDRRVVAAEGDDLAVGLEHQRADALVGRAAEDLLQQRAEIQQQGTSATTPYGNRLAAATANAHPLTTAKPRRCATVPTATNREVIELQCVRPRQVGRLVSQVAVVPEAVDHHDVARRVAEPVRRGQQPARRARRDRDRDRRYRHPHRPVV